MVVWTSLNIHVVLEYTCSRKLCLFSWNSCEIDFVYIFFIFWLLQVLIWNHIYYYEVLEVLHSAYAAGHVKITDYISFIITLLSRFKVLPGYLFICQTVAAMSSINNCNQLIKSSNYDKLDV